MERIIYRKTLDLHKSGVQFTLQGFQTADNMARTLELSLMASGDTIDLPLEQLMAVMYVTTPNAIEPSITDCKIKDNTVVCDVPPIVEEGITEIQIKLIETGVEGASGVLATPKFAIEVSKSNMDEEGATQNATFSALETALAKAKGVYDSRVTRIVLSPDCIFSVYYADGTIYTSDALKDVVVNGESLIAKSYARGGTGIRDGEDTDNSMYYSNVSKSASLAANSSVEESKELLEETRKHGIYTAFSIDFETGEIKYISPQYSFNVNEETGELDATGLSYTPSETVEMVVTEWLNSQNATIQSHDTKITRLEQEIDSNKGDVDNLSITCDVAFTQLDERITNLGNEYTSFKGKIADFIIEEKTFDDGDILWIYRKWNSGIAECWGTTGLIEFETTTPWGCLYGEVGEDHKVVVRKSDLPTELFKAVDATNVNIHAQGFVLIPYTICYTDCIEYSALSPVAPEQAADGTISPIKCKFHFVVRGRWKENMLPMA